MADRVIPILRHAILCENIDVDSDGRPFSYVPVHTIQFPPEVKQNYQPTTLHVYLQLQEALGAFNISVVLREERDDTDLFRSEPQKVEFVGDKYFNFQIVPMELDLELEDLVIPMPGNYEMWIIANHVNLHNPDKQPGWPFPPIRFTALASNGSEGGVV